MNASPRYWAVALIIAATVVVCSAGHAQSPPRNGVLYAIFNSNSKKAADLAGGSMDAGATVLQYTYHGTSNQQWTAYQTGEGFWEIVNAKSGMCMSVGGDHTSLGDDIVQTTYVGAPEQQWKLVPYNDGTYYLQSRASGMVLDVAGGAKDDGTKIEQWTNGGFKNQRWIFRPIPKSKLGK